MYHSSDVKVLAVFPAVSTRPPSPYQADAAEFRALDAALPLPVISVLENNEVLPVEPLASTCMLPPQMVAASVLALILNTKSV